MAEKGGEAAASYNIPQDLYGEILCRLPSRVLLKLKVVCKDWLRLISSNGFIQKHLQRSKADCNHLTILNKFDFTAEITDSANNSTSKKLLSSYQRRILGCCDGLVIYYDSCLRKIAAFNPCTGESLLLGRITNQSHLHIKLRRSLKFSWFGHHPFTDQYVLLLAYCESGIITFELYSLSPDRNIVDSLPLIISSSTLDLLGVERSCIIESKETGTLLHGRLHFPDIVCDSGAFGIESVILVYDFETKRIMKMAAHPAINHHIRMLGVVDGCLCAIKDDQVWMMKEYGVEESWTKYANLDEFPLTVCPNGDVIIISGGFREVVRKYSLRERETKIISKFSCYIAYDCIATVCIDSLISPTLLGREEE